MNKLKELFKSIKIYFKANYYSNKHNFFTTELDGSVYVYYFVADPFIKVIFNRVNEGKIDPVKTVTMDLDTFEDLVTDPFKLTIDQLTVNKSSFNNVNGVSETQIYILDGLVYKRWYECDDFYLVFYNSQLDTWLNIPYFYKKYLDGIFEIKS